MKISPIYIDILYYDFFLQRCAKDRRRHFGEVGGVFPVPLCLPGWLRGRIRVWLETDLGHHLYLPSADDQLSTNGQGEELSGGTEVGKFVNTVPLETMITSFHRAYFVPC